MFYMGGIDQLNDAPAFSLVDHTYRRGNCKVPRNNINLQIFEYKYTINIFEIGLENLSLLINMVSFVLTIENESNRMQALHI